MFPVIMEDGSSLDWRHANYASKVQIRRGSAAVENQLDGAAELAQLLHEGGARWALEIRCPRSLFAKTFTSQIPSFSVNWSPDSVRGPIYVTAGMVAVSPIELPCSGLLDIWGTGAIRVPQGAWLARGNMSRSENLATSLVLFRRKDELQNGQESRMSVEEVELTRFCGYLILWEGGPHDGEIKTPVFTGISRADGGSCAFGPDAGVAVAGV